MSVRDRKVCVIFENQNEEILLQKRDEEPEFGKWVLFGGSVEEGETDEVAVRREILEELNYRLGEIALFRTYVSGCVEQVIYIARDKVELEDLELHEGSDMKFFSVQALENINIGFNYRQILSDYVGIRA